MSKEKKYILTAVFSFVGITILLIITGIIMSLYFNPNNSNNNKEKNSNESTIVEEFSLSKNTKGYNEENAFYIIGSIRNNTDKQYSYVQVTFNLYNEEGVQVGAAMDNINNLEANGTWKFKAIGIPSEKVSTYKLTGITGI